MAELQGRLTSREFAEWMAYSRIEPFGAEIDHEMIAGLAALYANAHRDAKRKPFALSDFMPHPPEPVAPVRQDVLWARIDAAMAGLPGVRAVGRRPD